MTPNDIWVFSKANFRTNFLFRICSNAIFYACHISRCYAGSTSFSKWCTGRNNCTLLKSESSRNYILSNLCLYAKSRAYFTFCQGNVTFGLVYVETLKFLYTIVMPARLSVRFSDNCWTKRHRNLKFWTETPNVKGQDESENVCTLQVTHFKVENGQTVAKY